MEEKKYVAPANSPIAIRRVLAAEDKIKVLELRKKGYLLREIAKETGISKSSVGLILHRAMKEYKDDIANSVETLRGIQNQRLEALLRKHYELAMEGNPKQTAIVLQIMDRMAKLNNLNPEETMKLKIGPYDNMTDDEVLAAAAARGVKVRVVQRELPPHDETELPTSDDSTG